MKTVQPEVEVPKESFSRTFSILDRSLSHFMMGIQLLAMNSTPYSLCSGAVSLDFNHDSKSY